MRQNFQQSLMAMNLPLQNQFKKIPSEIFSPFGSDLRVLVQKPPLRNLATLCEKQQAAEASPLLSNIIDAGP